MFEKFDIEDKNIFKVCVVATMSSGKSTFINSIIGEEIMPEKNEACTARTMAVLDNDSAVVKKAHIIRTNGTKEVVEINNREILDRINNDEDVKDFLVETDIKSIKNTSRALMIFDTPGVNNSGDERHGQCTEQFLQKMDMGVIIYLLNATQLATNDDSLLLQYVSEHVKKQEGKVKIFFVINKIDALDLETESISGTINIAKEYIENHGIKNPIIYPFSALAAKVLRMALYRKEMTRRERRKLEDIYENYRTTDNFMLEYALLGNQENEVYEIGDEEVSKARLQRAIENTGIIAIEKRVEEYLLELENNYAPEVVIKAQFSESLVQELQECTKDFFVQPSSGQWDAFEECNQKIKESKEVQSLNHSVRSMEDIAAQFEFVLGELTIPTDVKEFISNIKKTKNNLYDSFSSGMYAPVKRVSGLFFYPENDEKECIRVKDLYLMSRDGLHWKAIRFFNIIELVEKRVEFYLFNEDTKFLFKVNEENGADIVGICDRRLPIATVKIGGFKGKDTSVIGVGEYLEKLIAEEAKKKYAAAEAEELLKRTYKGILFDSQKAKDDAIQKEEEIAQYCISLEGKSCAELWTKKAEISKLPSAIFSKYLSKIIVALEVQENKERTQFVERIQAADIDAVRKFDAQVNKPYYSEKTVQMLYDAIDQRIEHCQKAILDEIISGFEACNREELKLLLAKINEKNFGIFLIRDYVAKINRQYDLIEEKELSSICEELEQKNIGELIAMENLIRSKKYQDKFTSRYYQMIQDRRDFLHIKNLEAYCENLFEADREGLYAARKKVEQEACNVELKTHCYQLIQKREEQLDFQDFCISLEGKTCAELWAKNVQISKLPNTIALGYKSKLKMTLDEQEARECEQYMQKIQTADIDLLEKYDAEVNQPYYSTKTMQMLYAAIDQRRAQCAKAILDELIAGFEECSREELKVLIEKISVKNFDDYLVEDYVGKINKQYNLLEEKELRSICEGLEQKSIEELISMEKLIRSREYQDKFASKYYQMIQSRIEFLHVKNLEAYCESLSCKDREGLNAVRKQVDQEDCKAELKKHCYDLINQREEELDYQDLCVMTEDIANQPLEELSELYMKLYSGLYNEKFIKAFQVKVRAALEQAQLDNVEQMLSDLQNMNKEQLLEVSRQIEQCGYADRVVSLAREKIIERCYVLDMFELIALENDFNRLSLSEVRSLRNSLNHKNVCERSKTTYAKKLTEREHAIAQESVSQLAAYIQRQVAELGLVTEDIKIPTVTQDFDCYVDVLSKILYAPELREVENIPILIIPQVASLAMTRKYLYYESKSKCAKIDLNEIRAFSTEKKLLLEHLTITLRNGNVLPVSGSFNKKLLKQLAALLTAVVQNRNNSAMLSGYELCNISVSPLQPIDFELLSVPDNVTEEYVTSVFINKLDKVQLQGSSVKWITNEKWTNTERKLREEFGIMSDLKLIWCYDRTLFNTAKEGIAIGDEGVYIKNNNQPLVLLSYDDIFQVKMEGNQIVVETVKNERYLAEFGAKPAYEIINLIDEYIKGVQFIRFDKTR